MNINWPLWEGRQDFKIDYHPYKAISSTIREIISNTIKHSNASALDVQFFHHKNTIEFCFEDNGKGFDVDKNQLDKGLGLKNMKKRITEIGGELQISNKDLGLRIMFKVPL